MILAFVTERNIRREGRHSRLSAAHARRRPAGRVRASGNTSKRPGRRPASSARPPSTAQTNTAATISARMRARITIADVTLGNNLAIESGRSQLAHRTALLRPGR